MVDIKKDDVWFPGLEYLFGFGNLIFSDSVHYEFQIPKKDLMKFFSTNYKGKVDMKVVNQAVSEIIK